MKEKTQFFKGIQLLFFLVICLFLSTKIVHAKDQEKLLVEYYFYNSCDGCTEGEYFQNELKEKLKDVVSDQEYDFVLKDVSKQEYYDEFVELTKGSVTDSFYPTPPLLKIGDVFLYGMDDIAQHSRETIIEKVKGDVQNQDMLIESMNGIAASDSFFVYFYVPGCSDCEKAQSYFEKMNKSVYLEDQTESKVKMVYVNLGNFENVPLAAWFYEKYNVDEKDQKAPALFYQNGYLQGFEDIKNELPRVLNNGEAMNWKDIEYSNSGSQFSAGDWGMLLLTGLVNGLNPCGLSILLLLVSLLLEKREKVWKLGAAFIGAKILTYLLLGTVFSSIIGQLSTYVIGPAQKILKIILVIVFLIFAILNFMDVYLARKEKYGKLKMQLPARLKKFNNEFLKKRITGGKSTLILLFLAGIVVSAGEFLCTGQLYLASILYVMQKYTSFNWSVFLMFLVYVICMCLPLIIITLIANGSSRLINISEAFRKKMPLIKLLYGILFIIFAVLIFIL